MATEQDALRHGGHRWTTEIVELFPLQKEWAEAEYFALPDTPRIVELSEGELIMPPHPTDTHQRVLGNLYVQMSSFVQSRNLGVIRFSALPVRLWPGKIREPDIIFMLRQHADRIAEQHWGIPDLVVEVISPGTRKTDREDKFFEYAQAGVQEYWLVDPEAGTIEVYTLRNQDYELLSEAGKGQAARSQLLQDFQVKADDVFAD